MEKLLAVIICLLLSASVQVLVLDHCVSKDGSKDKNTLCQKSCDLGQCPSSCLCVSSNSTATCAKLGLTSWNKTAINETVKPGTPIITIQVTGQELWSYTLRRGGSVDGSVWGSLSTYLKLIKIGSKYELIVDVTPDLEDIFRQYGIKLTELTLVLTCKRSGFPDQINEIILQIMPVNEYAPEFVVTPLKTTVPENTKVGTVIYLLSDHTIDMDVNPTTNEISSFGLWEYLLHVKRDGRAYFQMSDTLSGSIQIKKELDFDTLQPMNAIQFVLNVSASDVHGLTSYTTLTIDVEDVDDLPPQFYHPSCLLIVPKFKQCNISYEATVPLHFEGQIVDILPGLIQARDMDSLNMPVQYSLKTRPTEELDNVKNFEINETTGRLFVLYPFLEQGEVHLVIVAKEVSENARYAQASLHVIVKDPSLKMIRSSDNSGTNTSAVEKETRTDLLAISTVFLSISVMILMVCSFALCIKLNTKRPRAVLPIEPIPRASHIFNYAYGLEKDAENQSPLSSDEDEDEEEETMQMDRELSDEPHQPNAESEDAPGTAKRTSHSLNNKHDFKESKDVQHSNSTMSSFEVERLISLTLSDRPNSGNSSYGRFAIPEYRNMGRGCIWRKKLFFVPNRAHQEAENQLTSNVLTLSDSLHTASYHQRKINAGNYQNLLSLNNRDNKDVHHISSTETGSDQTRVFKNQFSSPNVKKANAQKDEEFLSSNITKGRSSDKKNSTYTQTRSKQAPRPYIKKSRNRQTQHLFIKKMEYSGDSSDDSYDKESDDDYINDSSTSYASTTSYLGRKSATQQWLHKEMISALPLQSTLFANEDKGGLMRSSGSFTQQTIRKTTPVPLKVQDFVGERPERLITNVHCPRHERETIRDRNTIQGHSIVSLRVEENNTQSFPDISSHQIQTTKDEQSTEGTTAKSIHTSTSFASEALAPIKVHTFAKDETNKVQTFAKDETKFNDTAKELGTADLGRSFISSSSSKTSRSKGVRKKENSTERTSQEAVATNSSLSRETVGVNQIRPHTSDETKHTKKTVRAEHLGRPSTSAPSLMRRRTKKRKTFHEVNSNSDEYADEFVPDIQTGIFQTSYGDSRENLIAAYDPLELHLQEQLRYLHPWSPDHYLDHVEIHEHEYQVPLDDRQYWQSGREKVYVKRFLHRPYLPSHLQQIQYNHFMQQHRLYPVPEVPNRGIHHPSSHDRLGRSQGTMKGDNTTKLEVKSKETDEEEDNQDGQQDN